MRNYNLWKKEFEAEKDVGKNCEETRKLIEQQRNSILEDNKFPLVFGYTDGKMNRHVQDRERTPFEWTPIIEL